MVVDAGRARDVLPDVRRRVGDERVSVAEGLVHLVGLEVEVEAMTFAHAERVGGVAAVAVRTADVDRSKRAITGPERSEVTTAVTTSATKSRSSAGRGASRREPSWRRKGAGTQNQLKHRMRADRPISPVGPLRHSTSGPMGTKNSGTRKCADARSAAKSEPSRTKHSMRREGFRARTAR